MYNKVIDLPALEKLKANRIACPHCGNVCLERGKCPMNFPKPDCLTDDGVQSYRHDFGFSFRNEKQ